ncbi:hypothetical protein BJ322DRAFT_679725 [Thelephora terrestris]|uniref:Uncharacterized protein n=1 Tax=Thelephora terrestris TaxID=56493 RepID=A0A9P6HHG1_9AGAM|nr:hypothetical protein BJ322DRAFT_679725 [Thelephora terrestris]
MATNSRLARALQLQRIANTSRKFTPTTSTTLTATPDTPIVLKSLPEHKSLLPLLLSHNIPSKAAQACADRFDKYAKQLKSEIEAKLVPYLVNRRKNQPAKVYSLFLDNYSQALREWAQSILNAALRALKRTPAEIQNFDITYPPPLWLPSPPDVHSATTQNQPQAQPSFSSTPAPPHAFPTTYPPPLRPPCTVPPVEWPRTLVASSGPPSTSAFDLDSLCIRFAKSLVIDENPAQPTQTKPSIFSLPDSPKGRSGVASHRTKRSKSRKSSATTSQPSTRTLLPLPQKAVKPRRLSVPPSFLQIPSKVRPTLRNISAPVPTSSSQRNMAPPTVSNFLPPASPPTPAADLDMSSYFGFNTPHSDSSQSLFNLGINSTALRTSNSPSPSSGPTTPPILSSDLLSEPTVASPPFQLSEPFLATQFPLQYDLFPHDFLIPPYTDAGSSFNLSPGVPP